MVVHSYKDLIVWQKAIELVKKIYSITKNFPDEEKFGLASQVRRSAVSIPSNISEGRSRGSKKDFIRFLYIAKGSLSELETQILISLELRFIKKEDTQNIESLITEVNKMLSSMISKLKA
ncbi:MAG TPA: four helix bundle protein [Candidatus Dojkabacteria bacterium]